MIHNNLVTGSNLDQSNPLHRLLHPLSVPPFPQRHPSLEEQMAFENNVSGVRGKFMFYGDFVFSCP